MKIALMALLAIASIVLILSVLLQSGNSDGLSGSIAGGAEQLFGKKKGRGYEAILSKITVVCAVLFIVLSLAIVSMFS
ncbi:preprotein translocase subunit SecG [Anaerovoracaceae bacterium 41-7]|uniref:Protein-export membrane protein SecG n=1 Tax=Anaerotruncus colihominis TaxID=169435 RepID=A0A845QMS9_9FIRM|nr:MULTISPECIES: preprotein translocase subunit SecG [Clostridia]MCI5687500.1 preprotein translocase subunit SecG [Emergencia sp.]MCI9477316.1 preprotein translocase subunit SecG [Emergencia sp.]MCI9639279.1 preprotein translocase subunit SecG [Emergencia sp.]NBH62381.1 preprotein translocase subunit SecG [Anaerotruncus colihominis]NCE97539.1 preprotein translocase subunit SecG [Emergencia sp. 1XD21-10]